MTTPSAPSSSWRPRSPTPSSRARRCARMTRRMRRRILLPPGRSGNASSPKRSSMTPICLAPPRWPSFRAGPTTRNSRPRRPLRLRLHRLQRLPPRRRAVSPAPVDAIRRTTAIMTISAAQIKELREATGAGMLDCRKALEASAGDMDKAVASLREKGLATAAKRADRATLNGVVELYSHGEGRVGVMVELNCETDFVARTKEFRVFAHELALQVAAGSPEYVRSEDVPPAIVDAERQKARALAVQEGKPEKVIERIIDGRLDKFYDERCLLRQVYLRDDAKKVGDLLQEAVASTGENIVVRRFARWAVGEEIG